MPDYTFKHPPQFPKNKLTKVASKKTEEKKFSFCFEYSSIMGGYLCFNNPNYNPNDIIELIKCLKEISQYTIGEVFEHGKELHFHEVELKHHAYLFEIYKRTINFDGNNEQLPNLWQLEVFTDNERRIAPRITFFILSDGIAKIVYYDYHHLLCSRTYAKDNKVPDDWYEFYID